MAPNRRLWLVVGIAGVLVAAVLASVTHGAVDRSLRALHEATLAGLINAQANALVLERRGAEVPPPMLPEHLARNGGTYVFERESALAAPLMAARGKPDHTVMLLDPYVNHAGSRVIGAARWLEAYDRGVAVELDAEEAYAPLASLETALAAAGGLVLAAGLGWAAFALRRRGGQRQIGAYMIEREIGEGGMANVYLAHHALLKRPTALKVLKLTRLSEQFIGRFEREVKIASQLFHPNMVEIYDYGHTPEGQLYYAMEYLEGLELLQLVKQTGPMPASRVIHLLRQVCAGLAEAHAKGLVHRDIKPENLMLCRRGGEHDVLKILDFGLVKNVAEPHTHDLTRGLRILGTPAWMAPERFRSPADVDARADIYSLGAVGYYLLTGRDVFTASDDLELSHRILNDEAPRPSAFAPHPVPIELDLVITGCLEKRREDRPQRVTDLIEAFDALSVEHRWTRKDAQEWWAQRKNGAAPGKAGI